MSQDGNRPKTIIGVIVNSINNVNLQFQIEYLYLHAF